MVTEAALAQPEATFFSIRTTVLDLREQINTTQSTLCLLLADVPHEIKRGTLEGQQMPENFSVGIPLQMHSNRPDVRSAEMSLAQAFYGTNAAREAFYPTITLSGSGGRAKNAGAVIVKPGEVLL